MRSLRQAAPAAAVLAALLAAGCGGGGDGGADRSGADDTAQIDPSAGGFAAVTMRGLDGKEHSIADYEGRILMVNLVASWHDDSKAIVELMNEIARTHHNNVTVIAITLDDRGVQGARLFAKQTGATFDVFVGGESVRDAFGSPGRFPTTYVLMRDARLFAKFEGLQRYVYYHNTIIKMYQQRL